MKHLGTLCFVIALIFFIVAGGNVLYRYGKIVSNKIWKPQVICEVPLHNFGAVNIDKECIHEFVIKNTGGNNLVIHKVLVGCGSCVAVEDFTKAPIFPHKNGIVRLKLLTTHLFGKISKEVVVKTNDPKNPNLILTLEAEVIRPEKLSNNKSDNKEVTEQSP
ncbi:MAG: DUF1573 domain-containing protein [Planctomycetaceae bacterium]|jgi:hypothetical protein|nr:DUF1573 domain-containing protein [Planctomycetaceae bacterium]